jgi:hypothetical protein
MFEVGNIVRNIRPILWFANKLPIISVGRTVTVSTAWSHVTIKIEIPENNLFIVCDIERQYGGHLHVMKLPTLQDGGWQNWLDFELVEAPCPISK